MSEERKKERCKRKDIALKVVKGFLEKDCDYGTELYYSLDTALSYIDKLQEKNEELKEDNQKQWEERCRLTFKLNDYISKDKIRDKIKELEEELQYEITKNEAMLQIRVLQELLEEE